MHKFIEEEFSEKEMIEFRNERFLRNFNSVYDNYREPKKESDFNYSLGIKDGFKMALFLLKGTENLNIEELIKSKGVEF